MNLDPLIQCRLVCLGLLLVSAFALFRRLKSRTLFTASGGLHVNVLLFFGLGGLAYTFSEGWVRTFDPYDETVEAMMRAGLMFLIGYVIWILLEIKLKRSDQTRSTFHIPLIDRHGMLLIIVLWALSMVGRLGSDWEVSKSGVGTLLPVMRMFQYPIVALAISLTRRGKPLLLLVTAVALSLSGYLAFISPWRSDFILLGGAVSLGLLLRRRRLIFSAQALILLSLLFVLPFANEKKMRYDEVIADPFGSLSESLKMPATERLDFVVDFWAVRINGLREAAFVTRALEQGDISYRYGLTYWEATQQLIPRILWPDKPSFNQTTNYLLARQIGLLSWTDDSTSWGVNLYAEAIWNLGLTSLVVFVLVVFFLVHKLDAVIARKAKSEMLGWLVQGCLFFMFIDCVGLINMAAYLLWILILSVLIARILRALSTLYGAPPRSVLTPGVARS